MAATPRTSSKKTAYSSLDPDARLRRFISAIERHDWKTAERLRLSAPTVRQTVIDPRFARRVDALRRLTYRVMLVLLTAASWAAAMQEPAGGWSHGSKLEDRPQWDPATLGDIHGRMIERLAAAAELWVAFDRFCLDTTRKHATSIVAALSPGEQPWLQVVISRSEYADLEEATIESALKTMNTFWRNFLESDEETVLVLD